MERRGDHQHEFEHDATIPVPLLALEYKPSPHWSGLAQVPLFPAPPPVPTLIHLPVPHPDATIEVNAHEIAVSHFQYPLAHAVTMMDDADDAYPVSGTKRKLATDYDAILHNKAARCHFERHHCEATAPQKRRPSEAPSYPAAKRMHLVGSR